MQDKPALKVLVFFVFGILIANWYDIDFFALYVMAVIVFVAALGFLLWRTFYINIIFILCAIALFLTGFLHYKTTDFLPNNHISHFTNIEEEIMLRGMVINYPEKRLKRNHIFFETEQIIFPEDTIEISGNILLSIDNKLKTPEYGDSLLISGKLRSARNRRNPGEFDYREYLRAQRLYGVLSVKKMEKLQVISRGNGDWVFREIICPAKNYIDEFISKSLPPEESAFLHGLLIGERGEISHAIRDAFSKAGVIHILAVSGLHVGFVILVLMAVGGLLRIPYKPRVFLTIFGLVFFAYLTNLKPPVVRASMMGSIILVGTVLERKTNFFNSLALAALIILIINPRELFQPGFQLSFSAVAAIVYFYPKLQQLKIFKPFYSSGFSFSSLRPVIDLFLVSLAAFVGTLPFTIVYFNRIPNYSLFANLLVIPLTFIGLANGIVAAVLHLVWPPIADLFLQTTWLCLHFIIIFVEWFSKLPGAFLEIYQVSFFWILIYAAGILILFNLNEKRVRRLSIIFILIAVNFWIWHEAFKEEPVVEITFIDVGQGDSILLNLFDEKYILIDAGMRNPYFDNGSRVVAPFLKRQGINKLDAVVLSHGDSDHIGGVPYILRNFKVKEVWDNGFKKETRVFREYLHLIDSLKIEHKILERGDIITDFKPVHIAVVHPGKYFLEQNNSANDASLSLKISYGHIDFVTFGDIEKKGESFVCELGELLQSELLKVSHHGSTTSSREEFLDIINPEIAVISVGEFNKFGHPKEEVLNRLSKRAIPVLRTDKEAAIILRTDGKRLERLIWQ